MDDELRIEPKSPYEINQIHRLEWFLVETSEEGLMEGIDILEKVTQEAEPSDKHEEIRELKGESS